MRLGFFYMRSTQPIGIFDSGIGGLTVAKAVREVLPNETIIYFGDTAHLPYGDKSTAAIQAYSIRISDFLLLKKCKVILIACNSASSAAYDLVREYVGKKAMVFDVINPAVDYLRENYQNSCVGLIGTRQTIDRGVYAQKTSALKVGIDLKSLPTPLLVPMIEEGIIDENISYEIIERYLNNETLQDVQSLILGCTHYPIIKDQVRNYYFSKGKEVEVIDSSEVVARSLKAYLEFNQLLAREKVAENQFYVSDFTPNFEKTTRLFFGKSVHLEKYPIWDE